MPEALAYFLTWTTYGTWLPGDERGWVQYRYGMQLPDPIVERDAAARMTEVACRLDHEQRRLVESTIADHCRGRGWTLYAVNCRSNHVHVVVAADRHPKDIREQFKTWCTRRLKGLEQERRGPGSAHPSNAPEEPIREKWWSERGSGLYINDEEGLEAVIHYVLDAQDLPRECRS
jgi:REP element-mobilizing transposase RayT